MAAPEERLSAPSINQVPAGLKEIEQAQSAKRRLDAKIAKARKVLDEEREYEVRMAEAAENDTPKWRACPKKAGSALHEYDLGQYQDGKPVSREVSNPVMLFGAAGSTTPQFTRTADGRNAAVGRN